MPIKKLSKPTTKPKYQLKVKVRENEGQRRTPKELIERDRGEADPRKNPKGHPPKRS